jgi:F0F1-type ATP synthase membrane subunit b/b'
MRLEGEGVISLDKSLLIQFVIFLIFMILLNQLAFKPFLRFLELRHQRIFGKKEEAEKLKKEAEELEKFWIEQLRKIQEESLKEGFLVREEAKKEREAFLASLREELAKEIQRMRQKMEEDLKGALSEVENLAKNLAKGFSEKILGRPLG